jgi:adenylosuccinate synthase
VDPGERSLMIVGGQWGDEGKGKVVDLLAGSFPAVVRYNGGHNAGHTVCFSDRRFALHLVPSGVIHEGAMCYMASGMVIDPSALVSELEGLEREGVPTVGRVLLSPRATLILPTHRALDIAREGARGHSRIGTTGRGIGPAYADLAQRRALRAFLMADRGRLVEHARGLMEEHNRELTRLLDAERVDLDAACDELRQAAAKLAPMLREVGPELERHAALGESILFEGAQGVLLDLGHGTYPYVTSSSCLPAAAASSCGVGLALLGPVLGVMKAYATRVGGGPFPSELRGGLGDLIRERGAEYGTTTGRPRRCGWFDAVAARYAVKVAGIDAIAFTKLDVLDGLDELQVVVGYGLDDGPTLDTMPADPELLERLTPRLERLSGWPSGTAGATEEQQLAPAAQRYLSFLEEHVGAPIALVSTGASREETLVRTGTAMGRRLARLIGSAA